MSDTSLRVEWVPIMGMIRDGEVTFVDATVSLVVGTGSGHHVSGCHCRFEGGWIGILVRA